MIKKILHYLLLGAIGGAIGAILALLYEYNTYMYMNWTEFAFIVTSLALMVGILYYAHRGE